MLLKNAFKHFKKICIHKYWVGYYCFKCGIPLRGIIHDLSKFSPVEFWESAKYYQGTSSPINQCKRINGYSKAWQHHKGRNTHHYEYWVDCLDKGGVPIMMPYKDAVEMICDFLGAGRAYSGTDFTYKGEYNWWKNKTSEKIKMHPKTQKFVETVLYELAYWGDDEPILDGVILNRWYRRISHGLEAKHD